MKQDQDYNLLNINQIKLKVIQNVQYVDVLMN